MRPTGTIEVCKRKVGLENWERVRMRQNDNVEATERSKRLGSMGNV